AQNATRAAAQSLDLRELSTAVWGWTVHALAAEQPDRDRNYDADQPVHQFVLWLYLRQENLSRFTHFVRSAAQYHHGPVFCGRHSRVPHLPKFPSTQHVLGVDYSDCIQCIWRVPDAPGDQDATE